MEKLLLSPDEAAEVLGVGRAAVYDLMRSEVLRSVRIGRRRLIPVTALREMVDSLPTEPVR